MQKTYLTLQNFLETYDISVSEFYSIRVDLYDISLQGTASMKLIGALSSKLSCSFSVNHNSHLIADVIYNEVPVRICLTLN
jgi:hypothetical protein